MKYEVGCATLTAYRSVTSNVLCVSTLQSADSPAELLDYIYTSARYVCFEAHVVPAGGQCRRSNLVCQGYPSDLTFVRYSPMRVGSSHFQANVEDNGGPPQKVMRNPSPLGNSDQSLQNTAVDAYMFDNYWHSFFPRAKEDEKKWVPKGDAISSWIPAGWIFEMRSYTGSDQLIRTGLQANAYTIWGRKTDDKRLSVASMQAYSMVLQEVHRCLQDPEKCKQDSLLAACKFLALYEVGLNQSI